MNGKVTLDLIEVADGDTLRQILALRVLAWRSFVNIDQDLHEWTDKYDAIGRHWAILDDHKVIAAARLSIHEEIFDLPDSEVYAPVIKMSMCSPIACFNRLVVHPDYRGLGLSSELDEVRLSAAESAGCVSVIGHTHAGEKRVAQLVKAGFRTLGIGQRNEQGLLKGLVGVVFYRPLPRSTQTIPEVIGKLNER